MTKSDDRIKEVECVRTPDGTVCPVADLPTLTAFQTPDNKLHEFYADAELALVNLDVLPLFDKHWQEGSLTPDAVLQTLTDNAPAIVKYLQTIERLKVKQEKAA